MNRTLPSALGILLVATSVVSAATHYVSSASMNPNPPYDSWAKAATNIQDALNVALPGAVVLVTNGVYSGGLAAEKPLTLLSVNGPQFTIIDASLSGFWNRCISITNGVSLSGFTLTNGYQEYGGGIWCATTNAFVTNCVIAGNGAQSGGGVYGSTLYNCTLTGNTATNGSGGAGYSTLVNCVVSSNVGGGVKSCVLRNSAVIDNTLYGGGAVDSSLYNCTLTGNGFGAVACNLYNCIVYYNPVSGGANYDPPSWGPPASTLNYCCTTPLPKNGIGNLTNEPALAGVWRLSSSSPCRAAGHAAYSSGVDLESEPWASPPAIGCDEFYLGSCTGALSLAITASFTNFATGFAIGLEGSIVGKASDSRWEFGDGTVESNRLHTTHQWPAAGDYPVILRAYNNDYPAGATATVAVHVVTLPVHYVAIDSPAPSAPYTSWATAATNAQQAVDAASVPGSLVLVSNGVYRVGTSPVSVNLPITLRSVNGPGATILHGSQAPAVRCVTLNANAVLSGFTLTNGSAQYSGGGVYCVSTNAVVTNCVIAGNSAPAGGGAYGGTLNHCLLISNTCSWGGGGAASVNLNDCTLTGNSAGSNGGAVDDGTLNRCTLTGNHAQNGGGADWSTLNNCTLQGNSAQNEGGGVYGGTLNNCLVISNSCGGGGGGAASATLNNCTLIGNTAGAAVYYAGGAYASTVNNSIVYDNSAPNHSYGILNYCCTTPMPDGGVGNITNSPLFVSAASGDFHLQAASPCISSGNTALASGMSDLDGHPRIVATVDIGAYEFQGSGSAISYAWLQCYGFPTDGSADSSDTDTDGMNNWQEWVCGANPTNSLSVLRLLSAAPAGSSVTLIWQSAAGISYFLERSSDISSWSSPGSMNSELVAANITGQAGTTTYTDTNATGADRSFYRVGVRGP